VLEGRIALKSTLPELDGCGRGKPPSEGVGIWAGPRF
jgi:hypothetical protein